MKFFVLFGVLCVVASALGGRISKEAATDDVTTVTINVETPDAPECPTVAPATPSWGGSWSGSWNGYHPWSNWAGHPWSNWAGNGWSSWFGNHWGCYPWFGHHSGGYWPWAGHHWGGYWPGYYDSAAATAASSAAAGAAGAAA